MASPSAPEGAGFFAGRRDVAGKSRSSRSGGDSGRSTAGPARSIRDMARARLAAGRCGHAGGPGLRRDGACTTCGQWRGGPAHETGTGETARRRGRHNGGSSSWPLPLSADVDSEDRDFRIQAGQVSGFGRAAHLLEAAHFSGPFGQLAVVLPRGAGAYPVTEALRLTRAASGRHRAGAPFAGE